jgi:hypothetical protein
VDRRGKGSSGGAHRQRTGEAGWQRRETLGDRVWLGFAAWLADALYCGENKVGPLDDFSGW